jgi:Phosphatidylglycerophosphatase A
VANSNIQIHPPSEKKTLWAWALGTFFGAGLLKPGPGTYGSISAVLLWYAAAHILHPAPIPLAIGTAIAAILATLIGIPAATIVARESGREDPPTGNTPPSPSSSSAPSTSSSHPPSANWNAYPPAPASCSTT